MGSVTLYNESDMKTIKSQEEALRLFEENSIKQAQTLETGNFKLGNECFDNKIKCLSYLYKTNGMGMLEQLLSHENVGVRESKRRRSLV